MFILEAASVKEGCFHCCLTTSKSKPDFKRKSNCMSKSITVSYAELRTQLCIDDQRWPAGLVDWFKSSETFQASKLLLFDWNTFLQLTEPVYQRNLIIKHLTPYIMNLGQWHWVSILPDIFHSLYLPWLIYLSFLS